MRNGKKLKFIAVMLALFSALHLAALQNASAYLVGPAFSRHSASTYYDFNEFHPGIGGEVLFCLKRWELGVHGYYMGQDSLEHEAFWTGATVGFRVGDKNKLWCVPLIIAGGMKKDQYYSGRFSFFALPVISAGYKWLGFNLGYVPRLEGITEPILIFQLKIRIL